MHVFEWENWGLLDFVDEIWVGGCLDGALGGFGLSLINFLDNLWVLV